MGAVASTNPGLADLLQTLSNVNSPLLSSPSAVSALEKASPADIVKLSTAATQLEEMTSIFADSNASAFGGPEASLFGGLESANSGSNILSSLEAGLASSANASAGVTPPSNSSATLPSKELPQYQGSVQAAEADALLGAGLAGNTDSLFSYLG
jgi:hypothetical protein